MNFNIVFPINTQTMQFGFSFIIWIHSAASFLSLTINIRVPTLVSIWKVTQWIMVVCYFRSHLMITFCSVRHKQQGKSEGFESCYRPIVRKRPIWVKIGDVLSHVTLKFDGWPWKTIGHLSFAVSSFVQHFIAIGEFKLELQSGNAQSGSNPTIFLALWPWNLTFDLEKQ